MEDSLQKVVQIQWKRKAQAMNMTLCFLNLLTTISPTFRDTLYANIPVASERGSIFSDTIRFWHSTRSELLQLDHDKSSAPRLVLFLDCIRSFCMSVTAIEYASVPSAITTRLSVLLAEVVTPLLRDLPLPLPGSIETALCFILTEITAPSGQSVVLRQIFIEYLVPDIMKDKICSDRFGGFGSELQVRYDNVI